MSFLDWLDGEREAEPSDPHGYGPLNPPGDGAAGAPPLHGRPSVHTSTRRPRA